MYIHILQLLSQFSEQRHGAYILSIGFLFFLFKEIQSKLSTAVCNPHSKENPSKQLFGLASASPSTQLSHSLIKNIVLLS